jgi:hypothetical protein
MNWRKATYSGDSDGDCIEVASAPGHVMIRDTTNRGGVALASPPLPGGD